MRLSVIITAIIIMMSTFLYAGALEIPVTPGALLGLKEALKGNRESVLKLKGHADVRDLSLLKYVSDQTKEIDLSELTIEAYAYPEGESYMGRQRYLAGELPGYIITGTSVTRIILPDGITAIREGAFAGSALTGIVIPTSVTEIGDYICSDSYFLTDADIPASAAMSKGAFRNCRKLQTVTVRGKVTAVGESALEGCVGLKSNPYPDATSYGASALRGSGITSLDITAASAIGDYAFAEMSALKSVTLNGEGSTTFGIGSFYGDIALEDLPEWNANLPSLLGACSSVSLTKRINAALISGGAFANNQAPVKIILGPDVRKIARDAFRNNISVIEVDATELGKNIPLLDHQAFSGLENDVDRYDITLYVAQYYQAQWEEDPEWSRFNITGIDTSVTDLQESLDAHAERHGDRLVVISEGPPDYIEVFSISGIKVYSGTPASPELTIPVPPELLVVRIKAGGKIKIIKIP